MRLESAFRSWGVNTKTDTRLHADGLRFSKHTWPRFLRCASPAYAANASEEWWPGPAENGEPKAYTSKSKRTNQRGGHQRNLKFHCLRDGWLKGCTACSLAEQSHNNARFLFCSTSRKARNNGGVTTQQARKALVIKQQRK